MNAMRNFKKYFIFVCLFSAVFCLSFAFAQAKDAKDPSYLFYRANGLYEEAHYKEAIDLYNSVLKQGLESGNLYYNLGNCYFKEGKLGLAILNYERARRLIPQDKDLEANYNYAVSLIKYKSSEASSKWFKRFIDNTSNRFSIDRITLVLFFIYIFIILAVIIAVVFKLSRSRAVVIIALLGAVFIFFSFLFYGKITSLKNQAILVVESSDAKFEPLDTATTHFTIYEGMKVHILSSKDKWYKVKRPDGKVGWIRKTDLEVI